MEFTFLCLDIQLVPKESLENLSQMDDVFLHVARKNRKLSIYKKTVEEVAENTICKSLENSWGLCQSKCITRPFSIRLPPLF
jgi:hypothetical protein